MESSTIAIIITIITIISFVLEKIPLAMTAMIASLAMGIILCHVTESVSKRGMEKVRPGKAGKASHIKGNSERA